MNINRGLHLTEVMSEEKRMTLGFETDLGGMRWLSGITKTTWPTGNRSPISSGKKLIL
jgi:hypothetical protein